MRRKLKIFESYDLGQSKVQNPHQPKSLRISGYVLGLGLGIRGFSHKFRLSLGVILIVTLIFVCPGGKL